MSLRLALLALLVPLVALMGATGSATAASKTSVRLALPSTAVVGSTVVAKVSVLPAKRGQKVTVQYKSGKAWKTAGTGTTNGTGVAAVAFKPSVTGAVGYRATSGKALSRVVTVAVSKASAPTEAFTPLTPPSDADPSQEITGRTACAGTTCLFVTSYFTPSVTNNLAAWVMGANGSWTQTAPPIPAALQQVFQPSPSCSDKFCAMVVEYQVTAGDSYETEVLTWSKASGWKKAALPARAGGDAGDPVPYAASCTRTACLVGGVSGDDGVVVWRSTDGETWSASPLATTSTDDSPYIYSLTCGSDVCLVDGTRQATDDDSNTLVFWTGDGSGDWSVATHAEEAGAGLSRSTSLCGTDVCLVFPSDSHGNRSETWQWSSSGGWDFAPGVPAGNESSAACGPTGCVAVWSTAKPNGFGGSDLVPYVSAWAPSTGWSDAGAPETGGDAWNRTAFVCGTVQCYLTGEIASNTSVLWSENTADGWHSLSFPQDVPNQAAFFWATGQSSIPSCGPTVCVAPGNYYTSDGSNALGVWTWAE